MGNLTVVARILQDTIDTSGKSDRKMNYQNSIHVCLTFKSYSALNLYITKHTACCYTLPEPMAV